MHHNRRTIATLLSSQAYPGRALMLYWLGTLSRVFQTERKPGPQAERALPFYRVAAGFQRTVDTDLPGVNLLETPPVEVSEGVACARLDPTDDRRTARTRWRSWATSSLPPEVKTFEWKRRWGVLPTRHRLAGWGIVPNDQCAQCGATESPQHIFFFNAE